jgi:hypothetical protein
MTTAYLPQTVAATMARISAGADPWIAYRNFLEDWTYIPEARRDLVATKATAVRLRDRRWAALLAASVETLCQRDGLPAPAWTGDLAYRLTRPWYLYDGLGRMRVWLHESTPPAFARRNIWSGDRLLRRT